MTDVLVRDGPDDVTRQVTAADLTEFVATFADLADTDVVQGAWQ